MSAAVAYLLFAIAAGNSPDLVALATYPTEAACQAAAATIKDALATGTDGKLVMCIGSDSLSQLAQKNGASAGK